MGSTQQFTHKASIRILVAVEKMRTSKRNALSLLTSLCVAVAFVESFTPSNDRNSKHFSLFSVVQFNNEECTTDSTPAGGVTTGTCYTSTECTNKGGVQAGKCASGFGVCCAFLNNGAVTATVMENRTRLRNAEYPNTVVAVTAGDISYTINKMQTDICQIRLDFTAFVIAGPDNLLENIGTNVVQTINTHCNPATTDAMTIVTTDKRNSVDTNTNTLCGMLTGEHLYVELSPTSTDSATIRIQTVAVATTAAATAAATDRLWDIKVSQIECFAPWRAPAGCDRYFMADVGKITSFNFRQADAANSVGLNLGVELAAQKVKTCIRRSKGMCCVEYQLCTQHNGLPLADGGTNQANVASAGVNNAAGNLGYGVAGNAGTMQWINPAWSIDINTFPFVVDTAINVQLTANAMPVLAVNPNINTGLVDSQCSGDYVEIPSSWPGGCGSSHGSSRNSINSRYCGARFGANFGATNGNGANAATSSSTPVCDCSEPFVVRHNSDTVNDLGGLGTVAANGNVAGVLGWAGVFPEPVNTAMDTTARPRGFCLDYRQMPCWN